MLTLNIDFSCDIFRAPKLMHPTNSVVLASFPISRKRQMNNFVPDCGLSLISLKKRKIKKNEVRNEVRA